MRHKRSPTLFALTALALLLGSLLEARALAQAAPAQPAPTASAVRPAGANSAEYNRTMGAALRMFNLHRWDDALPLYEQAHALKPNARTLRAMGQCQYELHHYSAAAGLLTQALIDSRNPLPADQRAATADLLARASAMVGNVQLELTPRDAELSIDGAVVAVPESGALQLDPGHHELSAKAPGYELVIVQVDVVNGSNAVTLSLPASRRPVAAAAPQPTFVAPVTAPEDAPKTRRPAKIGLIVSGALLLAGGLIGAGTTGGLALKQGNDLHDQCPNNSCPVGKKHALDHARQLALTSNVLWGVAALGAGLGLIGILLPDGQDQAEPATTVQIGLGSVQLNGSF